MKKIHLFVAAIFIIAGQVTAQKNKNNSAQALRISLGADLVIPTAADLTSGVGIGIGTTITGEYPVSDDKLYATGSLNFSYLFKKKEGTNLLLLPVILAGARFYPSEKFYAGLGIGYARIATTGQKGDNESAGGFAFRPEMAYVFSETGEVNFKLTTFTASGKDTNGYGATHVSFGFAYRF
jgi:hypothetical protein